METQDTIEVSSDRDPTWNSPTKERILAVAMNRFRDQGFARVTIDDLCADLAMSKKTFYKFFQGKEALVESIADLVMADVERGVRQIIYGDLPFVEKVDRMMVFLGEMLRRIDRTLMRDLQRHMPKLWDRVQVFRRERVLKNVADLIAEGKRKGTIRPNVNARVFILAYLGAIESVVVPSVLSNESFSGEEALRSILTIFFNGVLTDEAGNELHRLQQSQL
jgi:AcrR family transcriptional regulator